MINIIFNYIFRLTFQSSYLWCYTSDVHTCDGMLVLLLHLHCSKWFLCLKTFHDLLLQLTSYLGEKCLKVQIRHLVETCTFCCIFCQEIVYRMEASLDLLLHSNFLPCICQVILLIKEHHLHSHLFLCKSFDWIGSYNLLSIFTATAWIWVFFPRTVLVTFHYIFYE